MIVYDVKTGTTTLIEEEVTEEVYEEIKLPPPEPTAEDRITALETMNDMLLDMVAENTYELCLMSLGIDIEED